MITIGIDLSVNWANTAVVVAHWEDWTPELVKDHPVLGWSDHQILDLIDELQPDKVAIDAPFGWPSDYAAAVQQYMDSATSYWPQWNEQEKGLSDETYRGLRLRETNLAVIDRWNEDQKGPTPISVSSDKIGATAMRAARLLTSAGSIGHAVDRTGMTGLFAEVYPAAALAAWGLTFKGYKSGADAKSILDALAAEFGLADVRSDHELDAYIAAIVAYYVCQEQTHQPPPNSKAPVEGWIHVPTGRGGLGIFKP